MISRRRFIRNAAGLLVPLVIPTIARAGTLPLVGAGPAGGAAPIPPTYVVRGVQVPADPFDPNETLDFSFDIGTAAADRRVWVFTYGNSSGAPSTAVTAAGTSLSLEETNSTGSKAAQIWSGLVTTGSGSQTVSTTWTGGAYQSRGVGVITTTGDVEVKDASTGDSDLVIAVTAGYFVFTMGVCAPDGTYDPDFTETPNVDSETITGVFEAVLGDLTVAASTASFSTAWTPMFPFAAVTIAVGPV